MGEHISSHEEEGISALDPETQRRIAANLAEERREENWKKLAWREKLACGLGAEELTEQGYKFESNPTPERRLDDQIQEHLNAGQLAVTYKIGRGQVRLAYLEPREVAETELQRLKKLGWYVGDIYRTKNGRLDEGAIYLLISGLQRRGQLIIIKPSEKDLVRILDTEAKEGVLTAVDKTFWGEK